MRLYLLSLLAIGSVQSHAIGSTGASGNAYRSGLLAYSPARGEFPVQSSFAKGYLRYIDGSGTEHLETYWYPEPLNGVRQLKYNSADIASTQAQSAHPQQFVRDNSDDVWKAREEYFRAWCEQRFRDLHAEIDRLRAAGITPPQEMLEQLEPLRKVFYVPTTATSEATQVQQASEEYQGNWNEARLRELYAQQFQPLVVPSFQLRSIAAVDAKETDQLKTQKLIKNEKLRETEPVIRTEPQAIYREAPVRLSPSGVVLETPEVMHAREEHFRLYNEAKLRAEKAGYETENEAKPVGGAVKEAAENAYFPSPPKVQIEVRQSEQQQVVAAPQTPANVEYLKSLNSASISSQGVGYKYESNSIQEHPLGVPLQQLAVGLRSVAGFDAPTQQQLRVVEETPEVKRAREEHLRLKKAQEEAFTSKSNNAQGQSQIAKAETVQKTLVQGTKAIAEQSIPAENTFPASSQPLSSTSQFSVGLRTGAASEQVVLNQLGHIEKTPEVKRAREEHLRLVEDAKLRATQYQSTNIAKSEASKVDQIVTAGQIEETPEVKRAREEHLRLKKAQEEAFTSKSNNAQGQTLVKGTKAIAEQSIPAENTFPASSQPLSSTSQFSVGLRTGAASKQVVLNQLGQIEETPEVKRAREEHLRLVEDAKLRATQYQSTNIAKSEASKVDQIVTAGQIEETPEVKRAREEHLQLVEEAKLRAAKFEATKAIEIVIVDGEKAFQQPEILRNEEDRLEAERIREEERLREDERQRDAKRLEEEQRNLEAELLRLRQEEEQRKESERLAEEQRLKEEAVLLKAAKKSAEIERKNQVNTEIIGQIRSDFQQAPAVQGSFSSNPYLVQFASPSGVGANYVLAEQRPVPQQVAAVRYYMPAGTAGSQVIYNQANPFLQRYTLENRSERLPQHAETVQVSAPKTQTLFDDRQVASVKIQADNTEQQQVKSSVEALSELERATREHFRAHEIALEQLHLAKLRNPNYKDCN